jgi:hypothetical protein
MGRGGADEAADRQPPLPGPARGYLALQGIVDSLLGLALLLVPTVMVGLWPWKITPLLAQLYAAPFLAYGLGGLLLSRESGWPPARIPVVAMLVFSALVLVGSTLHRGLFSAADVIDWLWFLGFAVATAALAAIVVAARRRTRA